MAETPANLTEAAEQAQLQSAQAPETEQDPLVQGMRIFFQRLQAPQQEQDAAREQGLGL